jgi:hypothetical protein
MRHRSTGVASIRFACDQSRRSAGATGQPESTEFEGRCAGFESADELTHHLGLWRREVLVEDRDR